MRIITTTAVAAVVLLMAAGCSGEKERLKGELAKADSTVIQLQTEMQRSSLDANHTVDSLGRVIARVSVDRDSLATSLKKASAHAGKLEGDLRVVRKKLNETSEILAHRDATLDSLTREYQTQMNNLRDVQAQLAGTQQTLTTVTNQRDSIYAFTEQLKPWYDYYKKDSGRNWAKKLFGRGRAKKPTTVEPEFKTPTPAQLEVTAP
jgi:chromosome segregation ATPase